MQQVRVAEALYVVDQVLSVQVEGCRNRHAEDLTSDGEQLGRDSVIILRTTLYIMSIAENKQ